ncbi:hypothetical protein GCM10028778_11650 [Barrientosiimonas marina]|uniref:Uncharacterized protein n=1 Tax=Lentibacillus kimchii TaxID=1542911 RepID=A0ABW2UYZ3_9BACI
MGMSTYLAKNILGHVLLGETYTPPNKLYLAAYTASGEVSASSYQRQEVTFKKKSSNMAVNNTDIYFPVAQEDWGTIHYYVLLDDKDNELNRASAYVKDSDGNKEHPVVNKNVQFGLSEGDYEIEIPTK